MADVTVTPADVRPLPGSVVRRFNAGGAVALGDAVYVAADGDVEAADADAVATAQVIGICVGTENSPTAAIATEAVDIQLSGPLAGFSSLTPGDKLYASVTAGKIADAIPAAAGDFIFVVGMAISAAVIHIRPYTYDVAATV